MPRNFGWEFSCHCEILAAWYGLLYLREIRIAFVRQNRKPEYKLIGGCYPT